MINYTRFRYCPRCGITSIRPHGRNAMECDGCGFLYYHNCAAAVAAIIETNGGIVLLRRAKPPKAGFFDLPGGFVDYGETLDAAVVREVEEEIGVRIERAVYFRSFPNTYEFHGVTYMTTDAVFICPMPQGSAIRPNDEVRQIEILPPESIDHSLIAFDSISKAIRSYTSVLQSPPEKHQ